MTNSNGNVVTSLNASKVAVIAGYAEGAYNNKTYIALVGKNSSGYILLKFMDVNDGSILNQAITIRGTLTYIDFS